MTTKTVHRICSIGALFLMLWMGLSGLAMQASDMYALVTHQRGDSPTMLATNEGKYGDGAFAVIALRDFAAADLPATLDYGKAMATGLAALRQQTPAATPRFAELRMNGDRVEARFATGQMVRHFIEFSQPVLAYDAVDGRSLADRPIPPIGPPLPPSLRSTGLEFHRFFSHGAGIGVWFMLVSGIVIWTMLITGLGFYFKLLKVRRRLKRCQVFWKAGGWWRTLHRGVSVASAAFLILIAFSGTWMAIESVYHSFRFVPEGDLSSPLSQQQVRRMTDATLAAFRADHPTAPIKVMRVRYYSGIPQGVVISGGPEVKQFVYRTDTGARQSLSEPGYPPSRFPFGDQLHQSMKRFHSGADYGMAARALSLLSGLSLVFLAVSGLVLYSSMWLSRRRTGRPALVWR